MDFRHDLRAVADRRGHPFHRSRPHVADGEDAAAARLQRKPRLARIGAGADEAAGIELIGDNAPSPAGGRGVRLREAGKS